MREVTSFMYLDQNCADSVEVRNKMTNDKSKEILFLCYWQSSMFIEIIKFKLKIVYNANICKKLEQVVE